MTKIKNLSHTLSFPLLLISGLVVTACGDDADTSTSVASGQGGAGGSGGDEGGATSTGGQGGTGGSGGGASVECLDASSYADAFELLAPELCVVARHTAPFVVGFDEKFKEIAPTWGRHGGPLTLVQEGNAFTLTRWKVPASADGALTVDTKRGPVDTAIAANLTPSALFLNAAAVDLTFGGWTAVGWAEFGSLSGELLMVGKDGIDERFGVTSVYAVAGLAGTNKSRVLTASSSALGATGADIGLHATDLCGAKVCAGGTLAVTKAGDASGPVVTDEAGNAFAAFPNINKGTQQLIGYAASAIAPGAAASGGATLATLPGSGTSLAALAPGAATDGLVFFQPAEMFVPGDVVVQRFTTIDSKTLAAKGATAKALVPKVMGTDVRLMTDDDGRLWAALRIDSTKAESVFFALARK